MYVCFSEGTFLIYVFVKIGVCGMTLFWIIQASNNMDEIQHSSHGARSGLANQRAKLFLVQ